MATISIRMKAIKDSNGRWIPDETGTWQYVALNLGAGRRPVWLPEMEKAAKKGGRGFQYRIGNGWSEQFPTIAEAQKAADQNGNGKPVAESNSDPTKGPRCAVWSSSTSTRRPRSRPAPSRTTRTS